MPAPPTPSESIETVLSAVPAETLESLFRAHGIAAGFIDFSGNLVHTSQENRLRVLAAMGQSLNPEALLTRSEQLQRRPLAQRLPPVCVATSTEVILPLSIPLAMLEEALRWDLLLESGESRSGELRPAALEESKRSDCMGYQVSERAWRLEPLPLGYHRLTLFMEDISLSCLLIVAPTQCHNPAWLAQGDSLWGLSAQLYTLVSEGNWGIGDLADLKILIDEAAQAGADFLLLNPLHALDIRFPDNASPYSPVDRRFLNPLYLSPQQEVDFTQSPAAEDWLARQSSALAALRAQPLVDYVAVAELKYQAFALMYAHFRAQHLLTGSPRGEAFRQYLQALGEEGAAFGRFQAQAGKAELPLSLEPEFHLYLQWLLDRQLEACQQYALDRGMRIGLIRDLAVGSTLDSCEVQAHAELFCQNARIGAPPDHFSPEGQNWGLPPLLPEALADSDYALFIQLLRRNMSHCGALRIDHVMALMRLWWCPTDGSHAAGAYVHYPAEILFAILRLESARAQVLVIGEDLGVVPPEIRSYLDEGNILSNLVFYFEKYDGWHFKHPHDYRQKALAIIANHDVPPLKAWWEGHDLLLRRQLGLAVDDAAHEAEKAGRAQEKAQMLEVLSDCYCLPPSWPKEAIERPYDADLGQAITRFCASTASQLVSLQLDDLALLDNPVNIPGTSKEYSNWRRKLPLSVTALFATAEASMLLQPLQSLRTQVE